MAGAFLLAWGDKTVTNSYPLLGALCGILICIAIQKGLCMEAQITKRGQKLLNILASSGKAMDRKQIAAAEGKEQLTPHDKHLLETLSDLGFVEKTVEEVGITKKFTYKHVG